MQGLQYLNAARGTRVARCGSPACVLVMHHRCVLGFTTDPPPSSPSPIMAETTLQAESSGGCSYHCVSGGGKGVWVCAKVSLACRTATLQRSSNTKRRTSHLLNTRLK